MIKGFYVHIPFCRSKCDYCAFYSITNHSEDLQKNYIKTLGEELAIITPDLSSLQTVYIGGGSPSSLSEVNLRLLLETLQSAAFRSEFTIEMNPEQVCESKLEILKNFNVSRVSLGVQSFSPTCRTTLGRAGSVESVYNAVGLLRKMQFNDISLDLIFAIPGSTVKDVEDDIETAIHLSPEHISAYSLTIEEHTKLGQNIESGKLKAIDEITDSQMCLAVRESLKKAGYKQYEISNFAKDGFACLHNISYWKSEEYLGIGAAAGSFYNMKRRENTSNVTEYITSINQGKIPATVNHLSEIEYAWQTAILMFRLREGIDVVDFEQKTGINFESLYGDTIKKNIASGTIEKTLAGFRLTEKGIMLADSVSIDFVL